MCHDHCCTDSKGIIAEAYTDVCYNDIRTRDFDMAQTQYVWNGTIASWLTPSIVGTSDTCLVQRDLCHFDGTTAVAPQLQLTANASAILNGWTAQDERMWSSVLTFPPLNADLVSRVEARTRYILRISDRRRSHWITHPYHRLCCLMKTMA